MQATFRTINKKPQDLFSEQNSSKIDVLAKNLDSIVKEINKYFWN